MPLGVLGVMDKMSFYKRLGFERGEEVVMPGYQDHPGSTALFIGILQAAEICGDPFPVRRFLEYTADRQRRAMLEQA